MPPTPPRSKNPSPPRYEHIARGICAKQCSFPFIIIINTAIYAATIIKKAAYMAKLLSGGANGRKRCAFALQTQKDGIYAAINIKMQKGAANFAAPFCVLYFISQKQY